MPNIYLKLDGVNGESKQKGYEKWIEVQSFSHNFLHPVQVTRGQASVGEVEASEFSFSKWGDITSVDLMNACCGAKDINKGELHLLKAAGDNTWIPYLKYEFEKPRISSISVGGSEGGIPTDSFTIFCNKVNVTYSDSDGNTKKGQNPFSFNWLTREVGK